MPLRAPTRRRRLENAELCRHASEPSLLRRFTGLTIEPEPLNRVGDALALLAR